MSKQFKRENRYIVLKLTDIEKYLDDDRRKLLDFIAGNIRDGRLLEEKPTFKCVVVEQDWPEYEPTWQAIERRVTGKSNASKDTDLEAQIKYMEREAEWYTEKARVKAPSWQEEADMSVAILKTLTDLKWTYANLKEEGRKAKAFLKSHGIDED